LLWRLFLYFCSYNLGGSMIVLRSLPLISLTPGFYLGISTSFELLRTKHPLPYPTQIFVLPSMIQSIGLGWMSYLFLIITIPSPIKKTHPLLLASTECSSIWTSSPHSLLSLPCPIWDHTPIMVPISKDILC
jgi:hypothetical protein